MRASHRTTLRYPDERPAKSILLDELLESPLTFERKKRRRKTTLKGNFRYHLSTTRLHAFTNPLWGRFSFLDAVSTDGSGCSVCYQSIALATGNLTDRNRGKLAWRLTTSCNRSQRVGLTACSALESSNTVSRPVVSKVKRMSSCSPRAHCGKTTWVISMVLTNFAAAYPLLGSRRALIA